MLKTIFMMVGITLALCDSAIAKRVIGYIPPPYYIRFLISIFTLTPIGFITGGLSYYGARFFDYETCMKNRKLFFAMLFAFIFIGSFIGASDGLNDECWNPAMLGSVPLSLIIPIAALILTRRFKLLPRVIISCALLIPSLVIIEVAIFSYQSYTYFELRWPTAW
jgi:hypothetical protein